MFHAVRQWWGSGRGKVTARLFLFEFAVVMVGVLAAQGLQSWLAGRADDREGEALLAEATDYVKGVGRVANYWDSHGQCLRDHVDNIARRAVAGETMTAEEIGRPGLPSVGLINLSEADRGKIGGVANRSRLKGVEWSIQTGEAITRYTTDISDQWANFRLLDGSIGPPSVADRARVRAAAAIIDNRIRWLMFNRIQFQRGIAGSGIPVGNELPESNKMVDDCGLLKDWR